MKGIILAGGKGTRLYPITKCVSKQLLPIYDKPMIYYPLSTLMLADIRDIMLISTPQDIGDYRMQFGDGSQLGINICYGVQDKPRGLADAFIVAQDFIGDDSVCLILGDNIFYGQDLPKVLREVRKNNKGATVFGYPVRNPKEFGVVEFGKDGRVLSIEEKPENPKSDYAIPGLYFYDNQVVQIAKSVKPSSRGEIEITDINRVYLQQGQLRVQVFGRGIAWLDTGSPKGMLRAAQFVENIQNMQKYYVSCIEEIAWRQGYISTQQLLETGESLSMTDYGQYLISLAKRRK